MFRHILLPTDGSELSRDTTRHAVSFAKAVAAQVTALYVKQVTPTDYEGDLIDPSAIDRVINASDKKAKEYLDFIKKLCKEAGVECTTIAVSGDHPYEEIVRAATAGNCDLIFMASHRHRGFHSLLLGSQTQKVLTHANLPVLVYRPPLPGKHQQKANA
jgi:nucleotide-binding universal stress UspA family protein